jgi:hypothetical protein
MPINGDMKHWLTAAYEHGAFDAPLPRYEDYNPITVKFIDLIS